MMKFPCWTTTTATTASLFLAVSSCCCLSSRSTVVVGFTPVVHHRPHLHVHHPLYSSPTTLPTDPSSTQDDDDSDEEWWKSVTFPHAHVAEKTRSEFPILYQTFGNDDDDEDDDNSPENRKPLIYLDSAATSQKPQFVMDALTSYYQTSNANVHRGAHTLSRKATAQYEHARDVCQTFVNAKSRNEIVFTSGATEALNLVAHSYGRHNLKEGDEILITVMEHHSNFVPWQILARDLQLTLKFIHVDPHTGMMDLQQLQNELTPRTRIVSFQHVSSVMGCIHPVTDIVHLIRNTPGVSPDLKIVLDACQSIPHMPVNVQELGVDFLAASGHKACGPTGIGFLWAPEDLLNSMEPFMSGGEMIDLVSVEGSTYAKAPARFEAGTPAIAQAIGMGAALEYLMDHVGMDNVEAYEHELSDYLYRRLQKVQGVEILGPSDPTKRAALCSFVCPAVHASDLSTFLDMEGIAIRAGHHCCQPLHTELGFSHSARASLYFYNTKQDIDIFIEKLQETLKFFATLERPKDDELLTNGEEKDEEDEDDFVPFI